MKRRTVMKMLLIVAVVSASSSSASAMYNPCHGRFMQRDVYGSGIPGMREMAFHGHAMTGAAVQFDPRDQYGDGANLYQYLGSNPVARRDPLGLFTYIDLSISTGMEAELRAQNAGKATIAMMFLTAMLGSTIQSGQWGVMGGMSGLGFDLFMDGVSESMSSNYWIGEGMMLAAEATMLVSHMAYSQAEAVQKARDRWAPIALHFTKLATGGPGDWGKGPRRWLKEIQDRLDEIASFTKHMGRKTSEEWIAWIKRCIEAAEEVSRTGIGGPPPMPG